MKVYQISAEAKHDVTTEVLFVADPLRSAAVPLFSDTDLLIVTTHNGRQCLLREVLSAI